MIYSAQNPVVLGLVLFAIARSGSTFSSRRRSAFLSLSSHSQIINGRQPDRRSFLTTCASRSRLPSNFRTQKAFLVLGTYANRHPRCLCQKHPCTKTAVRNLGSTISGMPGKSRLWIRKRKPRLCSSERTSNSGDVFFALMRDMFQLR
jgi:hypothetical protein